MPSPCPSPARPELSRSAEISQPFLIFDLAKAKRALADREPATIRDQASRSRPQATEGQPTTIVSSQKPGSSVKLPEVETAESAQPAEIPDAGDLPLDSRLLSDERAPFDRPFAGDEIDLFDGEDKDEAEESKTGFARPFAAPNESDTRAEASPESNSKGEIKA